MDDKKKKQITNFSCTARNLTKSGLGSVIFGCKHSTYEECLLKKLFGLPSSHYAYVRKVKPGMPLFLFNYTDRKLHGIFEAQTAGGMNIDGYAWTSANDKPTPFPAQVKVRIRQQCQPLSEDQFKPIIANNYYEDSHFWFELDKAQTDEMVKLFMTSTPSQIPRSTTRRHTINLPLVRQESLQKQNEFPTPRLGQSWCSVLKQHPVSKSVKQQETASSCNPEPSMQSKDRNDYASISVVSGKGKEKTYDCEGPALVGQKPLQKQKEVTSSHLEKSWSSLFKQHPGSKAIMEQETAPSCNPEPSMQKTRLALSKDKTDHANTSTVADKGKQSRDIEALISLSDDEAVDLISLTEEIILEMTLSDLRSVAFKLLHAMKKMKSSLLMMQDQINHTP